jgi:hypothetical protein
MTTTILVRKPGEPTYEMIETALRELPAGSYPAGTMMRAGERPWEPLPPELGGSLAVRLPEGDGEYYWRIGEMEEVRGPANAAGLVLALAELEEAELEACEVWWDGADNTWRAELILDVIRQRGTAREVEARRLRHAAELEAGRSMVPTGDEPGAGAAGIGWMVVGGGVLAQLASLAGEGAVAGLLVGLGGTLVVAGALVLVGDMVARRVERALGRAARRMAED